MPEYVNWPILDIWTIPPRFIQGLKYSLNIFNGGHRLQFSNGIAFLLQKIVFIWAKSADHDHDAFTVCPFFKSREGWLTLCLLGNFLFFFFVACWFFQNQLFRKNYFRITIRVSSSLDPDQARLNVGPDHGPNCLQRLSADNTCRQRVLNYYVISF